MELFRILFDRKRCKRKKYNYFCGSLFFAWRRVFCCLVIVLGTLRGGLSLLLCGGLLGLEGCLGMKKNVDYGEAAWRSGGFHYTFCGARNFKFTTTIVAGFLPPLRQTACYLLAFMSECVTNFKCIWKYWKIRHGMFSFIFHHVISIWMPW